MVPDFFLRLILFLICTRGIHAYEFSLPLGLEKRGLPMPADEGVSLYPPPMQVLDDSLYVLHAPKQEIRVYSKDSELIRTISTQTETLTTWGPFQDFTAAHGQQFFLAGWSGRRLVSLDTSMGISRLLASGGGHRDYFRSVGRLVFRDGFLFASDFREGSVRIFSTIGNLLGNIAGGGVQFYPLSANEVLRVVERGELSIVQTIQLGGRAHSFFEHDKGSDSAANSLQLIGADLYRRIYLEKVYAAELGLRKAEVLQLTATGKLLARQDFALTEKEYFEFETHFLILPNGVARVHLNEAESGNELQITEVQFQR